MRWATSGGCLSREAQIALSAVWEPTIETNQRPSVASSRAKASAVAEKTPGVDGVQGFGVECVFGCKHGYVSFR